MLHTKSDFPGQHSNIVLTQPYPLIPFLASQKQQ